MSFYVEPVTSGVLGGGMEQVTALRDNKRVELVSHEILGQQGVVEGLGPHHLGPFSIGVQQAVHGCATFTVR